MKFFKKKEKSNTEVQDKNIDVESISLIHLLKLPDKLFDKKGEIVIEAFAGYLPTFDGDEMPTTEYSIRIYHNNKIMKKILLNQTIDYGVVSEESIAERTNHVQMLIFLVNYMTEFEKMDLTMYKKIAKKRFSTNYNHLHINLPFDFELN